MRRREILTWGFPPPNLVNDTETPAEPVDALVAEIIADSLARRPPQPWTLRLRLRLARVAVHPTSSTRTSSAGAGARIAKAARLRRTLTSVASRREAKTLETKKSSGSHC